MNIFVLNSGRCGSTTFIKACQYMTNFTCSHESRLHNIGEERLAYPDNHIEADNRLSWFLGRLDKQYGDNAFYVHLQRNKADTAASFEKRAEFGILKAYREGILLNGDPDQSNIDLAQDYLDTVTSNIQLFLSNKSRKMDFQLENAHDDFKLFWEGIAAQGDLNSALNEWKVQHNASS